MSKYQVSIIKEAEVILFSTIEVKYQEYQINVFLMKKFKLSNIQVTSFFLSSVTEKCKLCYFCRNMIENLPITMKICIYFAYLKYIF